MKHRRCFDGAMPIESGYKLIVLERTNGLRRYQIHRIDLNRHLLSSNPAIHGGRSTSARRRRPSGFSLSRCNSSKAKNKKTRKQRHLTLGRFGRYLRFGRRQWPPMLPNPMDVNCDLELPKHGAMGVAVLDSKIYLIGGGFWYNPRTCSISRDVYFIDASAGSPELVKMSSELNYGKDSPIVCTIGGKIYAMPRSFTHPRRCEYKCGRKFECFDPKSNSWTVLRSPPVIGREGDKGEYVFKSNFTSKKFKIFSTPNRFSFDVFLVRSYAVVGSNLVISLDAGGVFTFDTTRPDRGWKRILLVLDPSRLLNFLPFNPCYSFPIQDDLVFCSPRSHSDSSELSSFLERKLNIHNVDSYVCSFDDVAALSDPECEYVKVSICSVTGMEPKWKIKTCTKLMESGAFVRTSRTIGDGMVLVANEGDYHYSFDIFHVQRDLNSKKGNYKASNISSALFRLRISFDSIDIFHSYVIKDGNFSH